MPVDTNLDLFVPPDGRITSQNPFSGTLDGDEVMEIVAPGNAQQGNTYQITLQQLAGYFAGSIAPVYEVTSGATAGNPYLIPNDAGSILFNIPTAEDHYCVAGLSSETLYLNPILIKDLAGTADVNSITISFSGGELCDGLSEIQITTAYGWYRIAPKPGGGGWYMC